MTKTLVVFGATGQQGGSVINFVLHDPDLSANYRIRAITRDLSKLAALSWSPEDIEVVQADADKPESLKSALHGADAAFIMTTPTFTGEELDKTEVSRGKAIADAAVAARLDFIIFSSLPPSTRLSNGKYPNVTHFNLKAEIEEYIRALPIKWTIYTPGWFMQNFNKHMGPQRLSDGTYAILNIVRPDTQLALIDVVNDTGKIIGPVLANPENFEGAQLVAASGLYTFEEIVQVMSNTSGKIVQYKKVTNPYPHLHPARSGMLLGMMPYFEEFGYYGSETKELLETTAKLAAGKLTTLEQYLLREPLDLE